MRSAALEQEVEAAKGREVQLELSLFEQHEAHENATAKLSAVEVREG